MAIGDVYMGSVWTRYQENDNAFSFCIRVDVEGDQDAVLPDIHSWMGNPVTTNLIPLHTTGVIFRCITARQIWPNNSLATTTSLVDQPGTRTTTQLLPGQLQLLAQLLGDKDNPTSRNRGRDFHYGWDAVDLNGAGSEWDALVLGEVCTFYQGLGVGFVGSGGNLFSWGIFSRKQVKENNDPQFVSNGGAVPDPPTFGNAPFNVIDHIRIQPLVRTQRRRQPEDPCAIHLECEMPAP